MCISVFGKRLSRKSSNVVVQVFPFAFHIAVQQPFKPLWSRLLLYDLEPSQASFALRFKSLLMMLLPASEEFLSKFPSSRYLSSSGFYPLALSGVGDPAGSNATADLALRVTGTHNPLHHDKVEIPSGGYITCSIKIVSVAVCNLHKKRCDCNVVCYGNRHVSVGIVAWNVSIYPV
jgi:hypothetical protein